MEQNTLFGDPFILVTKPKKATPQSLGTARKWVEDNRLEGVRCPCCDQFAKVYGRSFYAAMAAGLIWLVRRWQRKGSAGYVHVVREAPKHLNTRGAMTMTRHWGLIRQKVNEDTGKRCSGLWAPTSRGIAFAYDDLRVPRRAYVYDNQALWFSAETTSVVEALGESFSYLELMRTL